MTWPMCQDANAARIGSASQNSGGTSGGTFMVAACWLHGPQWLDGLSRASRPPQVRQ